MRAVHAYVAKIHVLIVDNDDVAVLQRQHLEGKLHREGGRRRNQPALVIRSRKAFSGNGRNQSASARKGRLCWSVIPTAALSSPKPARTRRSRGSSTSQRLPRIRASPLNPSSRIRLP